MQLLKIEVTTHGCVGMAHIRMLEPIVNCETRWKQGLLPNEHIVTNGIGD